MENQTDKNKENGKEGANDDVKGSDADTDKGITEGEFSKIGQKQAGESNIEEELKGSDADKSV